jgi:glycolate oxidase iron-sulfur subunit
METTPPATDPPPAARRQALSVFDAHHPPATELISECVHCGFCLATCPTYRLWGEEADSPRGRIYLMKLGLEGEVALDQAFVGHFDRCLGCMACLTSCPSGVKYDKLIEATRAQIERKFPRSAAERFFRRMIFAVFPFPNRLRLLAIPLWIYERSGLQRLVRGFGLLSLLPARLRAMERLAPPVKLRGLVSDLFSCGADSRARRDVSGENGTQACRLSEKESCAREEPKNILPSSSSSFSRHACVPASSAPGAMQGTNTRSLRVGLLLGCVQRVFFDDVNRATACVLFAEGCEVIVPRDQGCCGALMTHAGEETMALQFARRTIDVFEAANVDVIAINAAGCGSAMKEYGHLLRDDPRYAERAKALAGKCRDISEILAALAPRAIRHPLPMRVAYHDACHLNHAQGVSAQPRALLRTIPQLELLEIEDAAICCGSAGIYNMLQPEAAQELASRKAQGILKTGAAAVVSGNPGCTLQLRSSLEAAGKPMPVLHWVQLLDAAVAGRMPPHL